MSEASTGKRPEWREIHVALGSSADVDLQYANQLVVNFTGQEFLVTVVSAFPPPWIATEQPTTDVEGKVLARLAFSPLQWVRVVESIADQIQKLRAEGAPLPDPETKKP
jgi:hypothetical protein